MTEAPSYLESLSFKVKSAHFHRHNTVSALNGKQSFVDPLLAAGAEFIAMMSSLHSCLDVLAQWINQEYNVGLKEYDVSFSKVLSKINNEEMKQMLSELKESAIYLDDFCNYNKHRNIVKVKQIWYFLSAFQPTFTYDIDRFKRNGRSHPPQILEYQVHFQFNLIVNHLNHITGVNLIE